jgi:hypothetical protein
MTMYSRPAERKNQVDKAEFDYRAILKSDDPNRIVSIVAQLIEASRPLQAVLWSVRRKDWIYGPGPAARFLYDEQYWDRVRTIGRQEAEQIARDVLQTELPSEERLQEMCQEGERMGWTYGPPRQ